MKSATKNKGVFIILGALAASASAFAAAPEPSTLCAVPEALQYSELALPRVAARLKEGQAVRIVVIGSASSAGIGATRVENAYPQRLQKELARRFPKARFAVINLSKRGQLASEMAGRFATDVLGQQPALVIWQTGTVDAVRGVDVEAFSDTLESGIDKLEGHGADVILMNMQYSPHTSTVLDVTPYRDDMAWVAQSKSVILFDRYAMMRYWAEAGIIDFSNPSEADQAKNDDLVHGCLAYRLAEMVETAVKGAPAAEAKP
jgi:lysophospholipase L1-like esterase